MNFKLVSNYRPRSDQGAAAGHASAGEDFYGLLSPEVCAAEDRGTDRRCKGCGRKLGVDEIASDLLPEDKLLYLKQLPEKGHRVLWSGAVLTTRLH